MTALAVLPPDALVGVVESMDEITVAVRALLAVGHGIPPPRPGGRGQRQRRLPRPGADADLRPGLRLGPSRWMPCSPTAAATPSAWGSGAVRPAAVARRRAGEPAWDDDVLGAGRPAGTSSARRSRCEHLGHPFDVKGGGSDLVFPHHEMSAAQAAALTGDDAVRPALRAPGDGRVRGREDEQVQGQPRARVEAADRRGRPDGDPAGAARATTTAPTGTTRPTCSTRRWPGWTAGARRSRSTRRGRRVDRRRGARRRGRRPRHAGRAGRGRRLGRPHARGGVGRRRRHRGWCRARSTRSSASASDPANYLPTFPPDPGTFTFAPEIVALRR